MTAALNKHIDEDALRHNWRSIRRRTTAKKILAVVKSDAYGHGLTVTANALKAEADGFAVARLPEALALRAAGIRQPILLLQGIAAAEEVQALTTHNLMPVVHTDWQAQTLQNEKALTDLTVFIKINSGMNRLGFEPAQANAVMTQLGGAKSQVLMTHFARADEDGQIENACEIFAPFRQKNCPVSMSNSAATLFAPQLRDDWARVGIALYGASPAPQQHTRDALGLRAVMTVRTTLIAVRTVAAGAAVGYGGEFVTPEKMRIGIAAVGYGDGYLRRPGLFANIGGVVVPLIGRVSMEMIALDLRQCPTAQIGDEVILWGDTPGVDEVAAAANTIAYELLTRIGK